MEIKDRLFEDKPTIIETMGNPELFLDFFRGTSEFRTEGVNPSWKTWQVFLKAVFGLPYNEEWELEFYRKMTGRKEWPKRRFREAYILSGRRSGKSKITALIAVYFGIFGNWKYYLGKTRGQIPIMAINMEQAGEILDYVKEYLAIFEEGRGKKIYNPLIRRDVEYGIQLTNKIIIKVEPASQKTIRGGTLVCLCADELCHWRNKESRNPAAEVIRAARYAVEKIGITIGLSSIHTPVGYMYDTYEKYYGKENPDILIWRATTLDMRPDFDKKKIEREMEEDESMARAEYYSEWRIGTDTYCKKEVYEASVDEGVTIRPPKPGYRYYAFVDPSSSVEKGDSYALAIGHIEQIDGGERPVSVVIVDRAEVRNPPFNPDIVAEDYARIMTGYGIGTVIGDAWGGAMPPRTFERHSIRYEKSPSNKSELFLDMLHLLNMFKVRLLDIEEAKNQFLNLERSVQPSGRDSIAHAAYHHDDLANAIAGVCSMLFRAFAKILTESEMAFQMPHFANERGMGENMLERLEQQIRSILSKGGVVPPRTLKIRNVLYQKKMREKEKEKENGKIQRN